MCVCLGGSAALCCCPCPLIRTPILLFLSRQHLPRLPALASAVPLLLLQRSGFPCGDRGAVAEAVLCKQSLMEALWDNFQTLKDLEGACDALHTATAAAAVACL